MAFISLIMQENILYLISVDCLFTENKYIMPIDNSQLRLHGCYKGYKSNLAIW